MRPCSYGPLRIRPPAEGALRAENGGPEAALFASGSAVAALMRRRRPCRSSRRLWHRRAAGRWRARAGGFPGHNGAEGWWWRGNCIAASPWRIWCPFERPETPGRRTQASCLPGWGIPALTASARPPFDAGPLDRCAFSAPHRPKHRVRPRISTAGRPSGQAAEPASLVAIRVPTGLCAEWGPGFLGRVAPDGQPERLSGRLLKAGPWCRNKSPGPGWASWSDAIWPLPAAPLATLHLSISPLGLAPDPTCKNGAPGCFCPPWPRNTARGPAAGGSAVANRYRVRLCSGLLGAAASGLRHLRALRAAAVAAVILGGAATRGDGGCPEERPPPVAWPGSAGCTGFWTALECLFCSARHRPRIGIGGGTALR